MSAIGGIQNFNDAPIDRSVLAALSDRLIDRGPDGGRTEIDNSTGMVYRAFHTTHESRLERQPSISNRGGLLFFDGRLDNRAEPVAALQNQLGEDRTDVTLVGAAYEKWGTDFLPRLIGDFVIALWDPSLDSLLLARDVVGSSDLYYYMNSERIIWSSDLVELIVYVVRSCKLMMTMLLLTWPD